VKRLRIAIRFLTRFPVGDHEDSGAGDFGGATGFYPLVGLLAGLALAALRSLSLLDRDGRHAGLWSFGILLFWIWSCDSLHLDGLADTSDALASRKREGEFLAILHDSRVGAFGAAAISLALMAKFLWLGTLGRQGLWFLPLPLVVSRLHSALACQLRPYAGSPGSLSSMFVGEAGAADKNLALACSLGAFIVLAGAGLGLGLAAPLELLKALGVCLAGLWLGREAIKIPMARLGGVSGDLIGWSQVIVETAVAFGLSLALA
jgi:adenosylcobinamide-GDP ribazoletransferase